MLDGLSRSLGEVLHKALDHFVPLMVLEVHHLGPVVLSEGLELVDTLLPLVQRPLALLVKFRGTGDPVLDVKCLDLQVEGVNKILVVDIVG